MNLAVKILSGAVWWKHPEAFGKMMWGQLVWFDLMGAFSTLHCLVLREFSFQFEMGSLSDKKISMKLEFNYQYSWLSGKKQEPVVIWVTVCCDLPEKECEIQIFFFFFLHSLFLISFLLLFLSKKNPFLFTYGKQIIDGKSNWTFLWFIFCLIVDKFCLI